MFKGFPVFAPEPVRANDGYPAEDFERLFEVEADHFWFRSRNRLLAWAFRKYFSGAGNFFEVGCGTGFVMSGFQREFPDLVLGGGDIFVEGLLFAQQRLGSVSLIQMDALSIPFEDEFDVMGLFDVLEHIDEDETALKRVYRAIKPGGGVLITVPQHPALWSAIDDYSFHKRRYTKKELTTKLKRAGFLIMRTTSFVSFLIPLRMASRIRQRISPRGFDPYSELNVGTVLNSFLENVLMAEYLLIKAGLSLPKGGSLLAVAQKP